jgi:hypothetical protein
MPIFSYLAIPGSGAKDALCADLAGLKYCRVMPADNHDVVILVTDTPDQAAEEALQETLAKLQSLQSLSLAFGYGGNEL